MHESLVERAIHPGRVLLGTMARLKATDCRHKGSVRCELSGEDVFSLDMIRSAVRCLDGATER